MTNATSTSELLAEIEQALKTADELGLSMVSIRLSQALDLLQLEIKVEESEAKL